MRRLVDGVIAAGTIAVAAVVVWNIGQRMDAERKAAAVVDGVKAFGETIRLRAASEGTQLTGRGWPVTIDPAWFGDDPPRNLLLSPDRPWVQVASPAEANLLHPDDRVAYGPAAASFWYNPYQGIVRARVPMEMSDQRTLELYNRVNGTSLDSILPPARPFEPHPELDPDALAKASMEPPARLTMDEQMDPTRPRKTTSAEPVHTGGGD